MTRPADLEALRQRLLDLPVSVLSEHIVDTQVLPLVSEFVRGRVAEATEPLALRDRWLRERLEDAYTGALGAHTGSEPGSFPPILAAAAIRSILDQDLADLHTLVLDVSDPLPFLPTDRVHALVSHVVESYDWSRRHDEDRVVHREHSFDGRCGICRGDGQQIGHAVAFAYADHVEALRPEVRDALPAGPTLSRIAALVAEVVVFGEWSPRETTAERSPSTAHLRHRYDSRCAVCTGDADRLAEAVTVAYDALTQSFVVPPTADATT